MSRRKRKQETYLSLRLYPGQDDDLICWLEGFNDQPYGAKSQAIKDALRRGIQGPGTAPGNAGTALDLGEVRQVIEAAIESSLARLEVHGAVTAAPPEVDDETEDLLDALGSNLTLS